MFWGIFCDFRRAPISPSQLGLLWRCRGDPGRSRSAPRTALDALRAATAAAPKPILAKEARRYATHGQNRCQSWRFSNYFCFFGRNVSIFALLFNICLCFLAHDHFFTTMGSALALPDRPRGAPGRAPGRPGVLLDAVQMPFGTSFWKRVQTGF